MAPAIEFRHDAYGRFLFVTPEHPEGQEVEPVWAFPWSAREHHLVLIDPQGHPVAAFADANDLPEAARLQLQLESAQREFLPCLERIRSVSGPFPPCLWEVDTDRGPTAIDLESEEDVRKLNDQSALVTDSSGLRFLIANTADLDSVSRGYLRRYL
ncbi:DUF1854 domain-containing protein [bacterium]|nr:DUF1854 domain-containing protein [bacterium]